jgi:2-oxoglutarate dehydrogenase E2 component (dihydrolipoamide succinyltransferase)
VLRNVDNMGFADIEKKINELAKKANEGTISIDEMAGGTFTISNGGVYGSLISTPIINPPQVNQKPFNSSSGLKERY